MLLIQSIHTSPSLGTLPPMPELKYLYSSHKKHPDQGHLWMVVGKKQLHISSSVWVKPGNVCNDLLPFLRYIPISPLFVLWKKLAYKLQQDGSFFFFFSKMVLWDTSLTSSWFAGFLLKVVISWPNNSSLHLLTCCLASNTSLDWVAALYATIRECTFFKTMHRTLIRNFCILHN